MRLLMPPSGVKSNVELSQFKFGGRRSWRPRWLATPARQWRKKTGTTRYVLYFFAVAVLRVLRTSSACELERAAGTDCKSCIATRRSRRSACDYNQHHMLVQMFSVWKVWRALAQPRPASAVCATSSTRTTLNP